MNIYVLWCLCALQQALKSLQRTVSVYVTIKLLSAISKSQVISEFVDFPTDVSQTAKVLCCSTNAPNGFPSDKKKGLTTSQWCRNPSSSHVLSAFLVEHERSTAYQDGRFKFSMRASWGLSSTLLYTQAAKRICFNLSGIVKSVWTNKIWMSIKFDALSHKHTHKKCMADIKVIHFLSIIWWTRIHIHMHMLVSIYCMDTNLFCLSCNVNVPFNHQWSVVIESLTQVQIE